MPKRFRLYQIAGPTEDGTFPPGLNTAAPPTDIRADETADGYGFDLTVDGKLGTGTLPAGTARVAGSATLNVSSVATGGGTAVPFIWQYRRLWNITGLTNSTASNVLYVGAPNYDAMWLEQGPPMVFNEDAQTILKLVPFELNSLAVAKTTGCHILTNCSDSRGTPYFGRSDIVQALSCAAATYITELDGRLFVSNATGLMMYRAGETTEVTRKVRDAVTNFASKALTVDYTKHRIIGASTFAYDLPTDKMFRYSGSDFLFTTRQIHMPDYRPFAVDRVFFLIEHGDTSDGSLDFAVRHDDLPWGESYACRFPYESENYTMIPYDIANSPACRRFQVKVTSLSSSKYIKGIYTDTAEFLQDDYSV